MVGSIKCISHLQSKSHLSAHPRLSRPLILSSFSPPFQTLRDLVTDPAGESAASQLISALVTDQLEAAAAASSGGGGGFVGAVSAGVEAVAGALQRACPAYFKEADRTFYQVDAHGYPWEVDAICFICP